MARLVLVVLLVLTAVACVLSAPGPDAWFDLFGINFNQRPRPQHSSGGRAIGGKERYKQICRTISADNYAFPGRIPYPSAPVCPY